MFIKPLFCGDRGFPDPYLPYLERSAFYLLKRIYIVVLKCIWILVIQGHHDLFDCQICRLDTFAKRHNVEPFRTNKIFGSFATGLEPFCSGALIVTRTSGGFSFVTDLGFDES